MTNLFPRVVMLTFGMYLDPLTVVSRICLANWKNLSDFLALANRCGSPRLSLYANIMCFMYVCVLRMSIIW